MIFGQSAGAMSVDIHLTAYTNDPPFRAAILESGQYTYLDPGLLPSGEIWWNALAEGLNCSNAAVDLGLDCIKHAPVDAVRDVVEQGQQIWYPQVDNVTMVAHPIQARKSGNFAKVPIISGTVANEGTITAYGNDNLTAYLEQDFGFFPDVLQAVQEAYTRLPGEDVQHQIARIHSDWYFLCVSVTHSSIPQAFH